MHRSLAWKVISSQLDKCSGEEWGLRSSDGRRTMERLPGIIETRLFLWPYVVIKSAFWRILKTTLISRQLMNFTLIWSQPWFKKTVLTHFENNLDFKAIWTFHNVSPASFEKSVNNIDFICWLSKSAFLFWNRSIFWTVNRQTNTYVPANRY